MNNFFQHEGRLNQDQPVVAPDSCVDRSLPQSLLSRLREIRPRLEEKRFGKSASSTWSQPKTGCQGILLRGEVLFIEVDAKALNPLNTTSIHNAARMVESCATNPIRGGPARKPT